MSTTASNKITVRSDTRRKFDQIAKQTRWKLVVVADEAIDALIAKLKRNGKAPGR